MGIHTCAVALVCHPYIIILSFPRLVFFLLFPSILEVMPLGGNIFFIFFSFIFIFFIFSYSSVIKELIIYVFHNCSRLASYIMKKKSYST